MWGRAFFRTVSEHSSGGSLKLLQPTCQTYFFSSPSTPFSSASPSRFFASSTSNDSSSTSAPKKNSRKNSYIDDWDYDEFGERREGEEVEEEEEDPPITPEETEEVKKFMAEKVEQQKILDKDRRRAKKNAEKDKEQIILDEMPKEEKEVKRRDRRPYKSILFQEDPLWATRPRLRDPKDEFEARYQLDEGSGEDEEEIEQTYLALEEAQYANDPRMKQDLDDIKFLEEKMKKMGLPMPTEEQLAELERQYFLEGNKAEPSSESPLDYFDTPRELLDKPHLKRLLPTKMDQELLRDPAIGMSLTERKRFFEAHQAQEAEHILELHADETDDSDDADGADYQIPDKRKIEKFIDDAIEFSKPKETADEKEKSDWEKMKPKVKSDEFKLMVKDLMYYQAVRKEWEMKSVNYSHEIELEKWRFEGEDERAARIAEKQKKIDLINKTLKTEPKEKFANTIEWGKAKLRKNTERKKALRAVEREDEKITKDKVPVTRLEALTLAAMKAKEKIGLKVPLEEILKEDGPYNDKTENFKLLQTFLQDADYQFFKPGDEDVLNDAFDETLRYPINREEGRMLTQANWKPEVAAKQGNETDEIGQPRTEYMWKHTAILSEKVRAKKSNHGLIHKFTFWLVAGNGAGMGGFGIGQGDEAETAFRKAITSIERNMFCIPLYEGRTVPIKTIGQSGKTKVMIQPTDRYRGRKASPFVSAVLDCFGVHDCVVNTYNGKNRWNLIYAIWDALAQQTSRRAGAIMRGKNYYRAFEPAEIKYRQITRKELIRKQRKVQIIMDQAFNELESRQDDLVRMTKGPGRAKYDSRFDKAIYEEPAVPLAQPTRPW